MGQEQSSSNASRHHQTRHRPKEKPENRNNDYQPKKEHRKRTSRQRNSVDLDFKSDNSSTESSGYRSGSNSGYENRSTSERSSTSSEYYHPPLYKNDHYKGINRELYKPIKITKEQRHRLLLNTEKDTTEYLDKHLCIKSYLGDTETLKFGVGMPDTKKAGIRNYTPKILNDEEQKRKIENWI